jgi:CheY-like chemotaxis protein
MALRVLAVDDEPQVRAVVSHAFQLWGWECDEAADGEEALRALAAQAYDLVVTDVVMPRIDGVELIANIHANYPKTKVVAMTGRASAATRARLRQTQDPLLEKPFTLAQLKLAAEQAAGVSGEKPAAEEPAEE